MKSKTIQKLDITQFFNEDVLNLVEQGFKYAHKLGLESFDDVVLLYLLLKDVKVAAILGKEKVRYEELVIKIGQNISSSVPDVKYKGSLFMTSDLQKVLLAAFQEVKRQRKKVLGVEDLLVSFAQNPKYGDMFEQFDLDIIRVEQRVEKELGVFAKKYDQKTPFLDKYSRDMTDLATRGTFEQVVGRDTEQLQVIRTLARQEKNNVLLVGERGVGKKTIIEGLALNIADEKVPAVLREVRILEFDLHALRSLATSRDRLEMGMDQIRTELRDNPNVLIFIEDFDGLFKFEESRELFEIGLVLKPLLIKGEMRVVATIDSESYRKHIEQDSSLAKSFAVIRIDEPNEEIAVDMAKHASMKLAKYHSVEISGEAVRSSVYLSKRYLPEKRLPEKAIDLLDEACSKVALEDRNEVSAEDINEIISEKTGIPIQKITESEQSKLVNLEQILSKSVVGQDHAVNIVSESIRRARAGLKDPKKPVGSFLFMGPTGVGKTELAKVLSRVVYGDEKAMVRIDMSEFSESHTVQRLVGAPPGYVGYEEGGQLTNPVWERPYCLILLDEIEKAHPKVFDIFLQVLDDGRLTDGKGRTVDFKNTIIIATSNIASDEILEMMEGQSKEKDAREFLMSILSDYFRPEFINRFDAVVVFNALTMEVMKLIAKINVEKIAEKLSERGIVLTFSSAALDKIAKDSYDPQFGARPLLRYLQNNVENRVARQLISGEIKEGETIDVDQLLAGSGKVTGEEVIEEQLEY